MGYKMKHIFSKLRTIFAILTLFFGFVVGSSFAVQISNIRVSNYRSSSINISWITDSRIDGKDHCEKGKQRTCQGRCERDEEELPEGSLRLWHRKGRIRLCSISIENIRIYNQSLFIKKAFMLLHHAPIPHDLQTVLLCLPNCYLVWNTFLHPHNLCTLLNCLINDW